jgi:hypothetical protein
MKTTWKRRCGWVAAGWSVIFAAAHFFWALGGTVGLAVSAGPPLAAERPAWFVAGGLWGVGALCLVGAVIGHELGRRRLRGLPWFLVRAGGAAAGLILLARAITVETLLLAGSTLNNTVGPEHRFWTLVLWNPWFAAGGVAFLAAVLGTWGKSAMATGPRAEQISSE